MICLPDNYQKYDLPHHQDAVREPVKPQISFPFDFPLLEAEMVVRSLDMTTTRKQQSVRF